MKEIKVFKIGGNIIDNTEKLDSFLTDLAKIDCEKVLVHGGGKEASRLSEKLGIQPNMINGRRVTDASTIEIVTMVYAGLINKRIVSLLQTKNVDSIGLSGADANVIKASKRSAIPLDYGFVGDISPENVNTDFVSLLLNNGIMPVFCPIMHDKKGVLLNCNADSVAAAVAIALATKGHKTELTYCFEKEGVMADVNNPDSLIPLITEATYTQLKETGKINAGMIPKIENAFDAVRKGVGSVNIKSAENLLNNIGTKIIL